MNNMQQGVQTDATCNIQQSWELLANDVASVCTVLNTYSEPENQIIVSDGRLEDVKNNRKS